MTKSCKIGGFVFASTVRAAVLAGAAVGFTAPAHAQITIGVNTGALPNAVCVGGTNGDTLFVSADDDCDNSIGRVEAPFMSFDGDGIVFDANTGEATFNRLTTFNSQTDFNGVTSFTDTVSFSGANATFATPTTFTFASTFQAPTTFNGTTNFTAGMTTTNITNSGTINSANVNVTGSFTAAPGTTINMGGVNRIQGVAAGVGPLDAVNVAQLNAATAGIASDITALETTTATHTTQIANLETTTATHTTQIADLQTATGDQAAAIDELETTTATHTTQIATHSTQISGLETTTATHSTQISGLQTTTATQTTQIAAIQTVNTTQAGQISALELAQGSMAADIDTLFDLRSRDRRDMKQGVAAAIAIANAPMPSGPGRVSYAVNGATFRGEYAVGGSLMYRLPGDTPVAVNVGFSHAGGKNNGVRVGVAGEF